MGILAGFGLGGHIVRNFEIEVEQQNKLYLFFWILVRCGRPGPWSRKLAMNGCFRIPRLNLNHNELGLFLDFAMLVLRLDMHSEASRGSLKTVNASGLTVQLETMVQMGTFKATILGLILRRRSRKSDSSLYDIQYPVSQR